MQRSAKYFALICLKTTLKRELDMISKNQRIILVQNIKSMELLNRQEVDILFMIFSLHFLHEE